MSPDRRRHLTSAVGARGALPGYLLFCCAAAALTACTARPPYDPFKRPAREVRDRVRTIALTSLIVGPTLADRESARARIEPIVTSRLQAGGFAVVPSAETDRLWRRAAGDVHGIYDPVTGEIDKARFEAVQKAVYRDLAAEDHVDAVLYLKIDSVVLFLPGSSVKYCGTVKDESLYWPWPESAPSHATVAIVLCLNAVLVDLDGRDLYGIRHGLQTVETFAEQTRAVRPIPQRLQDETRLMEAIEATVGPLADAGKTRAH